MPRIKYAYIDPGGNPTVLVLSKVSRARQSFVAQKIMREKKLKCEQVGFIEPAKSKRALLRLQMMGGEFCGNALRAAVAFLANKEKNSSQVFTVETSGTSQRIELKTLVRKGRVAWSQAAMPVSGELETRMIALRVRRDRIPGKIVWLEGVTYMLIEQRFYTSRLDYRKIFEKLYRDCSIRNAALGLIFYKKISDTSYVSRPIVYVKKTDTLVAETSCASGSVALARAFSPKEQKVNVTQPSGFTLTVAVDVKAAQERIWVGGKIKSIKYGTMIIPPC